MKRQLLVFAASLLFLVVGAADGKTPPVQEPCFQISIDHSMWNRWGFQYPVTYVFDWVGLSGNTKVLWQPVASEDWTLLQTRNESDLYNGIECVRFDPAKKKAYVSIGFHAASTVRVKFVNATSVEFDAVAKYYDARKAVFTLSDDNWGKQASSHPGALWKGMADDTSDKYQAAVHACRQYHIPVTIAINSRAAGNVAQWTRMQEELAGQQPDWEPAVHTLTHPCSRAAYKVRGYKSEILDCRDDILAKLEDIPYGPYVFTFILPCAYKDADVEKAAVREFLFLRDWNTHDNLKSTIYVPWNVEHHYYGIGGLQTVSYDAVLQVRRPPGRYDARDVERLNRAFDKVYRGGGIFYAMWHSDRYQNSVIHDMRPGVDGERGSTLMQHFAHVANRKDVWYVANGWLYSYRYVAQNVKVDREPSSSELP